MFWADATVEKIKAQYKDTLSAGVPLIVRDEKTASGRIHVGSLRGVAIHGLISEILSEQGIKNTFLFEINDFDPMDGLPVYLDRGVFELHMGKPLCMVPSPDGKAKNFAEYYAEEFIGVINELGFTPTFYRSSDIYKKGSYDAVIKTALEKADVIRSIYQKVSGAQKNESWLPLSVICPECGKIGSTMASQFDGETVAYECGDFVLWAKGCGAKGRISPFKGNAKLPWKVEWAAKFTVFDVSIEGGGKDHSTRGGSRDVADAISKQVFERIPPFNIPYEFLNVGGKKMSSSKGAGISAREMADLLPPHMLRFLQLYKDANKVIDFIPDGDTVPMLYDTYDRYATGYFNQVNDDYSRAFSLIQLPKEKGSIKSRVLPRFSQVAFLVQMPHLDPYQELEKLVGAPLTEDDKKEIDERIRYARTWLKTYAPEDFRFELQNTVPEAVGTFTPLQKSALKKVLEFVKSRDVLDGQELHTTLHSIRQELAIQPLDFFKALYISFLNKESGPKAGWFLSVLPKHFIEKRLEEVL